MYYSKGLSGDVLFASRRETQQEPPIMITPFRATSLALLAALSVGYAVSAWAAGADDIKARQDLMKANGAAVAALKKLIDENSTNKADIEKQATILADNGRKITGFWSKDSTAAAGKTRAKDDIWTNPTEFAANEKAFADATAKLETAAKAGDMAAVKAAYDDTGKVCGACHGKFRGPAT
jgi:cytochrome c556